MASFVVYDNTQATDRDKRIGGMREAAERIIASMGSTDDPGEIIIDNIDDLINHANFDVKYTDRATGNEFSLSVVKAGAGRYRYNNGTSNVKVRLSAHKDREESRRNERMNVTAPGDSLVDLGSSGYLAGIISDLGGTWTPDRAKYLFATIVLRRCR
jgi:hypothetical protein